MSILKTIPIALDLKRVGAQAQALPTLVEGDNGNVFVISMTDDGEPLDLSTASRVICVFSKTSDGKTVEQDTEDANVALEDYGIAITGTPAANDTITIVKSSGTYTATISSLGITDASVTDTGAFDDKFPDDGTYVFTYSGTSWMYGTHSVTISGTDHNIVTVHLKSASYGAGTNNCEVQIYSGTDGDVLVTSANFNFKGRKGIMNDETIQSEEKYPVLVQFIMDVNDALKRAYKFTNVSASASTLSPGSSATANVVSAVDSVAFSFGIPKGETGLAEKVYIKYAADQPTSDGDMGDVPNNWIGFSVTTDGSAPEHYTDYAWYRIRGDQGVQGNADHMYIKWSATSPTSDADMKGTVDKWIGIHVSTAASAPTHYTDYTWYKYKGDTGDPGATGVGISNIAYTGGGTAGQAGQTDEYTVTLTNGSTYKFYVYNGQDGTGSVVSVNGKTGTVTLTASDVGADASGTASSAVSTHDGDASAHSSLFSGKQDTISDLATIRSGASDGATALTKAVDKVLFLTNVACSAITGDFATVSDAKITADHVVAEITFSAPNNVRSDVTWTTASGSLILNGKCYAATTANIVLIKKDN